MDKAWLNRSELLIGEEGQHKLAEAAVCVIGLGGVGSYAAEALVRAGIGSFILIDFDTVGVTNLNRQVIATTDSIGKTKISAMQERILSINPGAKYQTHQAFLDSENRAQLLEGADIYLDAIDSLGPKIGLLEYAIRTELKIISVMGAGNRLDPSQIRIAPMDKSHGCPLAKRVRKFLRRRGINAKIPCVYSSEKPLLPEDEPAEDLQEITLQRGRQRRSIGSISYMPAIMGMVAASWVIRTLLETEE